MVKNFAASFLVVSVVFLVACGPSPHNSATSKANRQSSAFDSCMYYATKNSTIVTAPVITACRDYAESQ